MEHPRGPAAKDKTKTPGKRVGIVAALGLASLLAFAQPGAAQSGCTAAGQNMQCTEFGTISMDSQRDIRGEPIDITAHITLNTAYADHAARWLLFSVRNVTDDGGNPVTIQLNQFSSPDGAIVTTRVEQPSPNEINLWVDTLDMPVGVPIDLQMNVGSTDRGAYRLETLVMAFDRGYAPVIDSSGHEASLFSFTLLGVNKETAAVSSNGGSVVQGHKLPALDVLPVLASLVAVAAMARRRFA